MCMKLNKDYFDRDLLVSLHTYARLPIAVEKAEGTQIIDVEGNVYLDMFSGLSVCNLGHRHPEVLQAIRDQLDKVLHTSNYFMTRSQIFLADLLVEKLGMGKVFFANSGAEAVEAAYKIARKNAYLKGKGGEIIALEHSFHGRTLATIATGKERHREGFGPMPSGFHKVPAEDIEVLLNRINSETAAIIVEPIQGEGGIRPLSIEYLRKLKEICEEYQITLIYDEIQCGLGRTGYFMAYEYYNIKPDIITIAKSLGGGLPISACIVTDEIASSIRPGDHGSTFGGNALSCAAGLASVQLLSDGDFLAEVRRKSELFLSKLEVLKEKYDLIRDVRGRGLMIGVELKHSADILADILLKEHSILVNITSENVLRLLPALIISEEEIEYFMQALESSLSQIEKKE